MREGNAPVQGGNARRRRRVLVWQRAERGFLCVMLEGRRKFRLDPSGPFDEGGRGRTTRMWEGSTSTTVVYTVVWRNSLV